VVQGHHEEREFQLRGPLGTKTRSCGRPASSPLPAGDGRPPSAGAGEGHSSRFERIGGGARNDRDRLRGGIIRERGFRPNLVAGRWCAARKTVASIVSRSPLASS
jgi:hypothetical protein